MSDAHVDGFYYRPRTDLETLAEHAEGLIGFTGCMQGWVPQLILRGKKRRQKKPWGRWLIFLVKKIILLNYIIMESRSRHVGTSSFKTS